MKFCYSDPPYPGQAERHYAGHKDFGGEVDHRELIDRMEREFPDGWALSTGAKNLQEVLALCPPVRTLIWRKPGTPFGDGFLWTFEPVLLRGCRRPERPHIADMVYAIPQGSLMTFKARPGEHVTGAKPPAFCRWLFRCMGARPEDELVDLFPGSGAVSSEWEAYRAQASLLDQPVQQGAVAG